MSAIDVVKGYAALAVGKKWIGVIEGNIFCEKTRKTPKKAEKDAKKLFDKLKSNEG